MNVVYDLAPHDVSIMNHLLGRHPDTVHAWAARHAHRRFEDVAYIRLHYRDLGLTANIHVSWLDPCKVRRITVVGSKQMAVYNDLAVEERIRVHDKGVELSTVSEGDDLTQPPMIYRYGDIVAPMVEFRSRLRSRTSISSTASRPEHDPTPTASTASTSSACSKLFTFRLNVVGPWRWMRSGVLPVPGRMNFGACALLWSSPKGLRIEELAAPVGVAV